MIPPIWPFPVWISTLSVASLHFISLTVPSFLPAIPPTYPQDSFPFRALTTVVSSPVFKPLSLRAHSGIFRFFTPTRHSLIIPSDVFLPAIPPTLTKSLEAPWALIIPLKVHSEISDSFCPAIPPKPPEEPL